MFKKNIEEQEADKDIDSDDGNHHQELPSFNSIKSIKDSLIVSNQDYSKKKIQDDSVSEDMPSFDHLPSVRESNIESQAHMSDRSMDQYSNRYLKNNKQGLDISYSKHSE